MSPDGENDIDGVGVPAPVQGRRSAMDGVGEKASVSVGERGSKKMCRFGVSGVSAPLNTSEPQVTPGVCRGALAAGAGAGAGA